MYGGCITHSILGWGVCWGGVCVCVCVCVVGPTKHSHIVGVHAYIAIEDYKDEIRRLRAYNTQLIRHIGACHVVIQGLGNVRSEVNLSIIIF